MAGLEGSNGGARRRCLDRTGDYVSRGWRISDNVNKPSHYNQGGIETIDSIRASTGDGFIWYCVGNADKYIGRCRYKGKLLEDLRKCRNYVDWAIEEAEKLEAAGESGNHPAIPDSSDRKPLAIPSGWRELEENEPLCEDDLFELDGEWVGHEYDPSGGVYSSRIHRQHIRKIEADEPKPLAIPEGWRELEPDEFPRVTDMYENEGAWRKRINDSSIEYARYDVRQIRKIEADEPKPLAIPEGWRELQVGEMRSKTDMYFFKGCWKTYGGFDPAGSQSPKYDKAIHRKQIRKIEPANTSETPNSSTPAEWVPKVGDKVRVVKPDRLAAGMDGVIVEEKNGGYAVRIPQARLTSYALKPEDLELIEAAP